MNVDKFEDANSTVILFDTVTQKEYSQLFCDHVKGCLPKEISFSSISRKESQLISKVKELFPKEEIIQSYRPKWLKRQEIDVFIPKYNIGIEYNRNSFSSFF